MAAGLLRLKNYLTIRKNVLSRQGVSAEARTLEEFTDLLRVVERKL
jgi:hypothetical protein